MIDPPACGWVEINRASSPGKAQSTMVNQTDAVHSVITDVVKGPIPPRVDNSEGVGTMHIKIQEVVDRMGPAPWAERLIEDERNLGTLGLSWAA